ncbi:hypothetical protein CP02DC18_1281A, partial [Chlamydia psittaci 02DC18]
MSRSKLVSACQNRIEAVK